MKLRSHYFFIFILLLFPFNILKADIGTLSFGINFPKKFLYPSNNPTDGSSARKFIFLIPGVGVDAYAHLSLFNTGLYLGAGAIGLADFDQQFSGKNSKVSWSAYIVSLRYYLGNLFFKIPACGPWIGGGYGVGKVKTDYDDPAFADETAKGKTRNISGGIDIPIAFIRLGIYYSYFDIKNGDGNYVSDTYGLNLGVAF